MSFSEISTELNVSKGAISKWLKGVNFTADERSLVAKKVSENILIGRNKSRLSKQMNRVFDERKILISAQNDFKKFKSNPLFLSGLSLYWAHGSFSNDYFQFTSANEEMLKIMIGWMHKFLSVRPERAKYRIFLADGGNHGKITDLWADSLLVPRGNFMSPVINRNRSKIPKNGLNKGSIQIVASGINNIRKIRVWQKQLIALLS